MPITNYKNTSFYTVTGLATVPANATKTGTIQTIGVSVQGTGTQFLTQSQLKLGDWICSLSASEIRKVVAIGNDTTAVLDHAFTADLAAASALVVAPKSDLCEISVVIPAGGANGKIDGITMPSGIGFSYGKTSRQREHSPSDFIDPIILDGTGTTIYVETLK